MKRVIIAVAMVVFLITLAATSNIIINRQMRSIYEDTKEISESFKSLSEKELKTKCEIIYKKWQKTENLLHFFDSHDKYENISEHFGMLELSVKKSDTTETLELVDEIRNLINNYIENRRINWHNVLIITKELQ